MRTEARLLIDVVALLAIGLMIKHQAERDHLDPISWIYLAIIAAAVMANFIWNSAILVASDHWDDQAGRPVKGPSQKS